MNWIKGYIKRAGYLWPLYGYGVVVAVSVFAVTLQPISFIFLLVGPFAQFVIVILQKF